MKFFGGVECPTINKPFNFGADLDHGQGINCHSDDSGGLCSSTASNLYTCFLKYCEETAEIILDVILNLSKADLIDVQQPHLAQ